MPSPLRFPVVTLNDLYNEPVRDVIDCFREFSNSFRLNPFKLITYRNSILINRCKIPGIPDPLKDENCFLSILLSSKEISMSDVDDCAIELALSGKPAHPFLAIYDQLFQSDTRRQYKTGSDWAFRQSIFALRIFLMLADEHGIEVSTLENIDTRLVDDALGIDKSRWRYVSFLLMRPAISKTPRHLLGSTVGFN